MAQHHIESKRPGASTFAPAVEDEETCAECGHAATVEPPLASVLLHLLPGTGEPVARCPVAWDDDYGLPADPCGCRQPAHAA